MIKKFIAYFMLFGSFINLAMAEENYAMSPKMQEFINKFELKKANLQGGTIAIMHKDQVVYKSTFGHQKDDTLPINQHTLLPLASVSKSVSAVAIALLVDKELINIDEKFQLPYIKEKVSLANLLSHTTGYHIRGNSEIEQGISRPKLLEIVKRQKPKCKPGKCYQYSNIVFTGVEDVLTIKGLSLKTAIENLRSALKTNEIQILPIDINMEVAYPHEVKKINENSSFTSLPFPPYYPKNTSAAAGIFASINAMIEFYNLSFGYRPDLISQKTLDIIYKPIMANRDIDKWNTEWPYERSEIESYYGLGWRILKVKQHPDKDFIFHSGWIGGIVSFIGYIPSKELGIIILLNQNSNQAFRNGIDFWGEFTR